MQYQAGGVLRVEISGMHCNSCVKTVERGVGMEKYVKCVSVDLEREEAIIELKTGAREEEITEAIEDLGFECGKIHVGKQSRYFRVSVLMKGLLCANNLLLTPADFRTTIQIR